MKTFAANLIRAELVALVVIAALLPWLGVTTALILAAVCSVGFIIMYAGITLAGWAWLLTMWMLRRRRALMIPPVEVIEVDAVGVLL